MAAVFRFQCVRLRKLQIIQSWGRRNIFSTCFCLSGHNRWSKIRHDKGREDAMKSKERSSMANELRIASALSGPDPSTNPRLATLILSAKKQGVPKSSIESAIARGQGKLSNGQTLESVVVEAMIPPSVATIIECHTDSKLRTLADVKLAIKECGGSVSSTNHLFKRKGKIIFGKSFGKGDEDAFEKLIDSITIGADFIDDDKLEVYTEPSQMNAAAVAIGNVSAREIESKEIIWDPIPEMMVDLTSGDASSGDALNELISRLEGDTSIHNIYTNAKTEDGAADPI